ncbi:MAG: hypothetical protein QNI86_12535 [Halieaceae bacterium]|nr:hypothetical protein [Halieaceae bacterium]
MTDMAGFESKVSEVISDSDALEPADKISYPVPARPTSPQPGNQPAVGVIDELLVGQVFLVQATIESASALGEGFQAARQALGGEGDIGEVLKRTRRSVFDPYRERYNLFRQLPRQGRD